MISRNKVFEDGMKNLLLQQQNDFKRDYDWIENLDHINFWDFLKVNFRELDRFFTLLDIERGPTSGWERFVEEIGLKLWEDRKWCDQYNNGVGPTKTALYRILTKMDYDENLNLCSVLLLIKEMDRFDILLQIDWDKLVDKYNNWYDENKSVEKEKKECAQTLVMQLNFSSEPQQLVQSENYGENISKDDNDFCENEFLKRNKIKNNKKNKRNKNNPPCILMTYAKDGENDAIKISEQLQQEHVKGNVKVLLMHSEKVKRKLLSDNSNILHSWFHQVRYIVPVLSPMFVEQIQNLHMGTEYEEEALHNRLIYRLTLDQYVSFGSRNLRCRPICPEEFNQVRDSSVIKGNGLFSIMWGDKASSIEKLRKVFMDKPVLPPNIWQK